MILVVTAGGFCVAFLLAWGLNWLALIPWRRSNQEHWTERARRLYPVRMAAVWNVWLIPANCILAQVWLFSEAEALWAVTGLCAWIGAILGSYSFDREVFPLLRFPAWLRYVAATWVLRFGVWAVFIGAVAIMPHEFGWHVAALVGGVLLFHLLLQYGLGSWLARRFGLLCPPTERLRSIVADTAQRMTVPFRTVWLLTGPYSFAGVWLTTRELLFSERLMDTHPDEEVAAICAHEMGHLKESKMTLLGRIVGSMVLFPLLLLSPALGTFGPLGLMLIAMVIGVLVVFNRRLARRMEKQADRVALENERETGTYARALERLYQTNQMPAVMPDNRRAHPHLYDRLMAAGVTPDYPRPAAPERLAWPAIVTAALAGMLAVFKMASSF